MKLVKLALAGTALIAISSGANAAIVTATFTGIVSSVERTSGLLGPAPAIGSAFTAVYTYDSSLAPADFQTFAGYQVHRDFYGVGLVSASITIGGNTLVSDGLGTAYGVSVYERADNYPGGNGDRIQFHSIGRMDALETGDGFQYNISMVNGFYGGPGTMTTSANLLDPMEFSRVDPKVGQWGLLELTVRRGSYYTLDLIELRTDTVSVTVASAAVPETATWAMMIIGFGVAGAALRRRNQSFDQLGVIIGISS